MVVKGDKRKGADKNGVGGLCEFQHLITLFKSERDVAAEGPFEGYCGSKMKRATK